MLAVRNDGAECPITAMFDIDGEPTTDPEMAVTVIVLLPDNSAIPLQCPRRNIVDAPVN